MAWCFIESGIGMAQWLECCVVHGQGWKCWVVNVVNVVRCYCPNLIPFDTFRLTPNISFFCVFWFLGRKNAGFLRAKVGTYAGLTGAFEEVPRILFLGPSSSMRTHFNLAQGPLTLGDNVQKQAMAIKGKDKKEYLEQLASGLHYLHHKRWVHMELSLDTVLVS